MSETELLRGEALNLVKAISMDDRSAFDRTRSKIEMNTGHDIPVSGDLYHLRVVVVGLS